MPPNHNDETPFIEDINGVLYVDTPWGIVRRTPDELKAIEKEIADTDWDVVQDDLTAGDDRGLVEPTLLDLVEMCTNPDGSPDMGMVRSLQSNKKQWEQDLKLILARTQKIEDHVRKQRGLREAERKRRLMWMTLLYVDFYADQVREKLDRVNKVLSLVGRTNKGDAVKLRTAKQVPITSLVKFNRGGFACCVWHKEKSPSMKYYKKTNTVYCFGACQHGGDVIDVYMALTGCSIKDAIRKLAP